MDAIKRVRSLPRIGSTADGKQGSEINCGSLTTYRDYKFNADEAKEVLDSLLQNKELETLVMDQNHNFGSLESCRALRELVRTSTTLKHLSLCDVRMNGEGLKLIVEGILSNSQSALEALDLGYNEGLVLADVDGVTDEVGEGTEQSTDRVNFLESWMALGKLVRTSTTLKHLSLRRTGMKGEHLKQIVEGMQNNSQAGLETLDISFNEELGCARTMLEGVKQLTDLLQDNTRGLATLDITFIQFSAGEMKSIGKALASNTTLINLAIGDCGFVFHDCTTVSLVT